MSQVNRWPDLSVLVCVYCRTDPAVWYPWWCEGSCPARPWPHRTSPPPRNAACCVCQSPWDSPGPGGSGLYTREKRTTIHWPIARNLPFSLLCSSTMNVCMYTLHSYLLRDAVAEVLLLKVGQLQQWWLGLLQALHYHLGQLHAILYGYQSRSVETWKHTDTVYQ